MEGKPSLLVTVKFFIHREVTVKHLSPNIVSSAGGDTDNEEHINENTLNLESYKHLKK